MYGVIYVIVNLLNSMRYVGQTRQRLKKRMYQHAKANSYIGRAIRHYGWKNFTVEVLEECDTPEQLNERERFWIAYFNCKHPNGYNLTDGGDGIAVCTQETRDKMSVVHKGVPKSPEHRRKIGESERGENHYNFGKNLSAKHLSNLSAARRDNSPFKNLLNELDKYQLSYGALAKLLGISQASVSRKMHGIQGFTAKEIAKLVEIFGLTAEHLMARDD